VLDAKIVGIQKQADLALLKVEATNLPTLRLNRERSPQPGELVFAIGSPEGLQNSVTMGVISSVWRQPDPDNPMVYLQTDAPIDPGNSGGPLVDVTGAVVGLNTFILSKGGGSEGLGFAIPARIVDFISHSLRKYGHVDHIEIGVVAQTITPTMGVVIADVIPSGPADAGGIRAGDYFGGGWPFHTGPARVHSFALSTPDRSGFKNRCVAGRAKAFAGYSRRPGA
jgi:serine protease Do